MIAEIGHFALIIAFIFALLSAVFPLWGAHQNNAHFIALARPLAYAQFLFILLAFIALTWSFYVSDFSVLIVAQYSHTDKPLLYKLAGVWGNHEGSLLLWALILSLFGGAVALFGRNLPRPFLARVLSVQALITLGFLLFMLTTSNPFLRLIDAPLNGNGLNPLLQDPGLAFHPPLLYLGYVGLSVAFSFSIAALIEGNVTAAWARWVRPWTLVAWAFLTCGIGLGSWWAYYELGWGGWWTWDPVENASFMPWLAATALLHSATVVEKRDALKRWTILLAILAFSLSLIGTFIVRSGVLTSVHSFAVDPARGVFILAFLLVVVGGSLSLYAVRASSLEPGGLFQPISREGALVFNNLFLLTGLVTVFLGTFYPLIIEALTGDKLTVGAPFYNKTFNLLMIPLLCAMAIGPLMHWKKCDLGPILNRLKFIAILALVIGFLMASHYEQKIFIGGLAFTLGLWIVCVGIRDIADKIQLFSAPEKSMQKLGRLRRSYWGTTIAHVGLGVALIGMTGSEVWTEEKLAMVAPGDAIEVSEFQFRFDKMRSIAGPNYTALEGQFTVMKGDTLIGQLKPQERTFLVPRMQTTEAAIISRLGEDLYVVIGGDFVAGKWSARVYVKPLVLWIWIGLGLMVIGALTSLTDRRYRVGEIKRRQFSESKAQAIERGAA